MKMSKRILSLLLALVMLTTCFTSALYASAADAKAEEIKYSSITESDISDIVRGLLGEYSDGEQLVGFINGLVADSIGDKLIYDENGRKILSGISPELSLRADSSIEELYNKYVPAGDQIVAFGNEKAAEFLNTQKIMGVPIMQLRYVQNLDELVSTNILVDNSDIMNTAANTLKGLFPNVEPSYESIVSCLIPLLSAFDFGAIMANTSNLSAMLGLASPVAFAYLAGLTDAPLDADYLNKINSSLAAKGYTGSAVTPLINLSDAQKTKLMEYVAMEKAGTELADIAAAGFNWTDFTGDANRLDIANAFVKIALGDSDKLGALADNPNIGSALVRLLCDLLNDLKEAPVTTILKKVSDSEGICAILDFVTPIINGDDSTFKSMTLWEDGIRTDGKGNTCFFVDYENGEAVYTGPKQSEYLMPVIFAAIDLLSNISGVVDSNNGDILKTLFVDKLPQVEAVIKSFISYESGGAEKIGMAAYLLNDYKPYLQALNAVLCDDILISISQASIEKTQEKIEQKNAEIGIWQGYLAQAKAAEDAAKLAEAKKQGVFDETVTTFDEAALDAAIETKIASLQSEVSTLEATVSADEQALQQAQSDVQALQDAYDDYSAKIDELADNETFIEDLSAIFDSQDISELQTLRDDCEDWFDDLFGSGKFNQLAAIITELYDQVENFDEFFEAYILGEDGLNLAGTLNELDSQLSDATDDETGWVAVATAKLNEDIAAKTAKSNELDKYVSGAVKNAVLAADDNVKLTISDNVLDIEGDFSSAQIESAIEKINNVDIAELNTNIASEEAEIQDYNTEKADNQALVDAFDNSAVVEEISRLKGLAASVMVFLGGNETTKSLYEYFNDGMFIEMIAASDRVSALRSIIDELISIFAPLLPEFLGEDFTLSEDYMDQIWAIEDVFFGEKGVISTLYDDFVKDPVLCVVSRIKPLVSLINNVVASGIYSDVISQYVPLANAVGDIFGDTEQGFIKEWMSAYDDGGASHHYVNALLSLLPKIVAIYDSASEVEVIKEFIEPYEEMIEIGLGILTKDFYDSILENGFIETILNKEILDKIEAFAIAKLQESEIENKEYIVAFVDALYHNLFDTLYEDLLSNPTEAIVQRVNTIHGVLTLLPQFVEDFDLSKYQDVISVKFFEGYLALVPEEYQDLLPKGVTGLFTMLLRSVMFGPQYVTVENSLVEFNANTYYYFTPAQSGKYVIEARDIKGELSSLVINGVSAPLTEAEGGKKYIYTDLNEKEVYELLIDEEGSQSAGVLIYKEDHEHVLSDVQLIEPGCETAGSKTGVCDICGKTVTETIQALGHKAGEQAKENEVKATCEKAGSYDLVVRCTVCQKELSKQNVTVPALGHDWGEWTLSTSPKCDAEGVERRVCNNDASHIETRPVAKLQHTPASAVKENEVAAGCEAAGSYDSVVKCSVCGEVISREKISIPATGHKAGAAVKENEVAATCEAAGSYDSVLKCSVCGKELSRERVTVPAIGHKFAAGEQYCQNGCGSINPDYVPPHTHSYTSAITTQATCTQEGVKTFTCTCGETYIEPIAALGHDFSVENVIAATAVKAGYTEHRCSRCDALGSTDSFTNPTGKPGTIKCSARTANAETITWSAVKGAQGYQIRISTKDGKKWDKTFNAKTATKYTVKSLAAGYAYKFSVRIYTKAQDGNYYYGPWSKVLTSPTLPKGTAISKLKPASKSFTAQWKANKTVNGYQIQYGLKSNFKGAKTLTVKSAKTLKATVKKLNAKKVYYVRIRTYKTISKVNYFSAWSKTLKVKTK